jgi:ATP-binding protein involved in chromosome partitioning
LPPGTGDITLSLAQNVKLDGVLIVTTPQDVAVIDADKCAQAFSKLNVPILGVIENMSFFTDPSGLAHALFGVGGGAALAARHGAPLLGQLPLDPTIGLCADTGRNFITDYAQSSAAGAYRAIATGVAGT